MGSWDHDQQPTCLVAPTALNQAPSAQHQQFATLLNLLAAPKHGNAASPDTASPCAPAPACTTASEPSDVRPAPSFALTPALTTACTPLQPGATRTYVPPSGMGGTLRLA
eukprot:CAMPEP_0202873966 /NCGR_PEP_ID=MMETSP1391-20130828/24402_1 /ASSEMBLY_ACC=CAM_ASM_000867 /TAXON_ID=1034604 /ORGANISM="Chlamydomonas leiostraca, Strain SAG 11-49" /LENGTH=109 /DNA_ID=CAMNT_0049555287 /DNA_START=169 /DNA_END=496 /DNA_ORIENTATION=+